MERERVKAKNRMGATAVEKLVDVPYDTRVFKKDGAEVAVPGFRDRLQAAIQAHEQGNRETYSALQEMIANFQQTIITLDEAQKYDVKDMLENAKLAAEQNTECFNAINELIATLQQIEQAPIDFDAVSGQIVEEMLSDLAAVGALNASNEAIKTLEDYKQDYDEITVHFYKVIGGKDKGERTREYYTEKTTKTTTFKNATAKYQGVVEKIHERLSAVVSHAAEASAELASFAKEVVDVMSLWSLYQSQLKPSKKNPNPQKMWKEKPVTDAEIIDLIKGYDFYKEIADKLSFRKEEEGAAVTERKLHAMRKAVAMLMAKAESLVNAPAFAAGVMAEYTDSGIDFGKEASQGLREITAVLYAPQTEAKPGFVDRVKDFARGLVPEQAPAMVGAAQRVKADMDDLREVENAFRKVSMSVAMLPIDETKRDAILKKIREYGKAERSYGSLEGFRDGVTR